MNGKVRKAVKRAFFAMYKLCIRMGVHVLPVHYHSPIPDILELQNTKNVWANRSELPGVAIDLDRQTDNLRTICLPYQSEYMGNKTYWEGTVKEYGRGYGPIEAQALHAVIRYYQPSKIIEVGSGVSTYCMLAAVEKNKKETGHSSTITCIEPYPSDRLKELREIQLIPQQVQAVPFQVFTDLRKNDLLFIDSSHTVKPGGDVNYLILEVLPRLRSGVIVHFHDIFFPYDYQRNVLQTFFH